MVGRLRDDLQAAGLRSICDASAVGELREPDGLHGGDGLAGAVSGVAVDEVVGVLVQLDDLRRERRRLDSMG